MTENTNLIKALRCLASQDAEGDCYMERYNLVHAVCHKPAIYCGANPPDGRITCPYYQNEYGVCFEDGECGWLGRVADILEQYQENGTVEDCREARERQIPKPPNIWGDGYDNEGDMVYDMYDCPNCGKSYEIDYHDYKYCPECGQAIDRSDSDKLV